jgi:lysophospholipase L1-like esterase
MKTMRTFLFAFVLLGTIVARDHDAAPAAPTATAAGVTVDGLVYPTNSTMIDTPKAGILGLRAIDIPRYTQTGPLPNPAPERHWVLPPEPHNPKLPTIWTIGDSTVRCGVNASGDDMPGQWGWGTPFVGYFDPNKINVVNRAVGGTTSASFYTDLWKGMVDLIKKDDVVIMQFGTNSGRGELPGIGEETQQATGRDSQAVTNHTYGWYVRKFIAETRAKGATPVVCSLIPRGSRIAMRGAVPQQAVWARDVAAAEKADFIDLHELVSQRYDTMDGSAVNALFSGSPHTNWAGAVINAETVISGLKALKSNPVAAFFVPQVKEISAAPDLSQPVLAPAAQPPPATRAGPRGAQGPAPQSVSPRDSEPFTPNNFTSLKPNLPTLIIAGDSTADKGPDARHRGWAAVLIDYFDTNKINVVNRARGGRSCRSFVREGLWDELVAAVKPGDFVMIQFGHNDGGDVNNPNGRPDLPGTGDDTQTVQRRDGTSEVVHTFGWYNRKFFKDVRNKGGTAVLVAATPYNRWTNGKFVHQPGDLSEWARQVADQEKVLFLNHTDIIGARYDQLGEEAVRPFFPADFLHTSTPGAIVNAEMFIAGMKTLDIKPLVDMLNDKGRAIPAYKPAAGASADKLMLDEPWDYNRLPEATQDRTIQWRSANMH